MQIITEKIVCPNCGKTQLAEVGVNPIWNVYVHECKKCKYIIMESEWDKVKRYGTNHNRNQD